MVSVEKQRDKVLASFKPDVKTARQIRAFDKVSKQFDQLVEAGILKKRGNQQRSVENAHLNVHGINKVIIPDSGS